FFFSSRRRHTRSDRDWSSDVCSSDLAVVAPEGAFEARPALYWSAYNQAYMKKPHIERYLTHDIYISPLEMVGDEPDQGAVWFSKGETRQVGAAKYTFIDFDRQMGDVEIGRASCRERG